MSQSPQHRPPSKDPKKHTEYRRNLREERRKQRKLIDGRWVSQLLGTEGYPDHGAKNGYDDYFCRCDYCSETRSMYQRALSEERKAQRVPQVFDGITRMVSDKLGTSGYPSHGSDRGRRYFFCECPACIGQTSWTQARRNHFREQRELVNHRLVSKILGTSGRPDHGTVVGFQEYSCRCDPCTQAHTRDWLERDPRGVAAARQAARQAEPQDDPVPR